MGDIADWLMDMEMERFDRFLHQSPPYRRPLHLAKQDITCSRCGVPAYWQEVINKEGQPEIKLFAGGKPHDCRTATADDFEDETGADIG